MKMQLAFLCLALTVANIPLCAWGELQPKNPIRVKGLVVSTSMGLALNDGTRDYLLLGVDDIGLEGRVCEIFGDLTERDGHPAIDVYDIHLIFEEYPNEDQVGVLDICPHQIRTMRQSAPLPVNLATHV